MKSKPVPKEGRKPLPKRRRKTEAEKREARNKSARDILSMYKDFIRRRSENNGESASTLDGFIGLISSVIEGANRGPGSIRLNLPAEDIYNYANSEEGKEFLNSTN